MQSNSIPSCSKAPRGLSVFPRVASIFAGTTVSPSPSLRQHRNRYAFHAGQKLPDKEFRYHRTVMVTADVHQAFGAGREPFPLSVWHWTGVSPYTSACALAETCVFGKQSFRSFHCNPNELRRQPKPLHHQSGRSFSRSYGAILPSSLTRVLSRALGFSPCLPVSVCGTGTVRHSLEVFPGSMGSVRSPPLRRLPTPLGVCGWRIFLPSLL